MQLSDHWRHTEDVFSPLAHPAIAIFELARPFDHRMMPWKFCDDISNGSGVRSYRVDKHPTHTLTHTTENNTTLTAQVVNARNITFAVALMRYGHLHNV